MKNKTILCLMIGLGIILGAAGSGLAQDMEKHNYMPEGGYVASEQTAISIAVAVWVPIYGQENIENEKPYKAILKDDVWYVSGSLPEGWLGGVAEAEIDKKTGKILRISHGK
ncbi:MAG: YbbC/YhhH family protein [Candidatus Omnitrophica bacterium]|nr:YbbC/YhhH family protein [Candidatus Omnitrophota bacterium]